MYLSKGVLAKSFQKLGDMGSKEGKTRLERVSAISRFLACAEILRANNIVTVDLAPKASTRSEFVQKVGKVLGLGPNHEFTPDFADLEIKSDYNVGSNFLTTQVHSTRNSKKNYPSRPAPLLTLDHEKASIHPDFRKNLDDSYDWHTFKSPFSIWLSKDYVFTKAANPKAVVKEINAFHRDRFGATVGTSLELEVTHFEAFIHGIHEPFSEVKPDLVDLANNPAAAAISTPGYSIPSNKPIFSGGENVIFYGAPGTGKSNRVDREIKEQGKKPFRTVFYPDLQNSDFFGCLKPQMEGGDVRYEFSAGPFMRALAEAYLTPTEPVYLVIEELNRAAAASVFGDLFLLLDRDDKGNGEYDVSFPSIESKKWFEKQTKMAHEGLRLPSNFFIYATMNSADQGVYPIDTAFRRRWRQVYLPLDYDKGPDGNVYYTDTARKQHPLSWREFVKLLNNHLSDNQMLDISEDRLIGQWFVKKQELGGTGIPDKVLLYLWDDLLRHEGREHVFDSGTKGKVKTYGDLVLQAAAGRRFLSDSFLGKLNAASDVEAKKEDEFNDDAT